MKLLKTFLLFLALVCAGNSYGQNTSGAFLTPKEEYNKIGEAPLPVGTINQPQSVDLSGYMPPVGNQGAQNSCVAWAVAYANYSYLNKLNNNQCDYNNNNCLFSPSFVYNQINGGQNRGTFFQDAFAIMQTQGVAPLSAMPYLANNYSIPPSNQAREIAKNYKIGKYLSVSGFGKNTLEETKAFIARGFPVIASVKVDNYLKKTVNSSFPTPYIWRQIQGPIENMGHAIVIVGYNDDTKVFKFINSYGNTWGNNGYGYIHYNIFNSVVNEAYITMPLKNIASNLEDLVNRKGLALDDNDISKGLYFKIDTVEHIPVGNYPPNVLPNLNFTFRGQLQVPRGLGKRLQVAVYFYLDNGNGEKGQSVGSVNPYYRTINGQACAAAPEINLPTTNNFVTPFYISMNYYSLEVPKGYPYNPIRTQLIAEPVLLIDGFPLRKAELHRFFVQL